MIGIKYFIALALVLTILGPTINAAERQLYTNSNRWQLFYFCGTSLIESSNEISCLIQKYSTSCDSIPQIYKVMDNVIFNNALLSGQIRTREALINYYAQGIQRVVRALRSIYSKCHGAVDCQFHHDSGHNSVIAQEILDMTDQLRLNGNAMLRILENHPSDLVLSALGEILNRFVTELRANVDGITTSVGLVLSESIKSGKELLNLENYVTYL